MGHQERRGNRMYIGNAKFPHRRQSFGWYLLHLSRLQYNGLPRLQRLRGQSDGCHPAAQAGDANRHRQQRQSHAGGDGGWWYRAAHQVAIHEEGGCQPLRDRMDGYRHHVEDPQPHGPRPHQRHQLPVQGARGEQRRPGSGVRCVHRNAARRGDADGKLGGGRHGDADDRQPQRRVVL